MTQRSSRHQITNKTNTLLFYKKEIQLSADNKSSHLLSDFLYEKYWIEKLM